MTVVLVCDVCGEEFRAEAEYSRRSGYQEPSRDVQLFFGQDEIEGCSFSSVCPSCVSCIADAVRTTVKRIKEAFGKRKQSAIS